MSADRGTVFVAFHENVYGGATRSVARLVRLLEQRGWRFVLWAPKPSALFDALQAEGHDVRGAPRHVFFSAQELRTPPGPAARTRSLAPYTAALWCEIGRVKPVVFHANTLLSLPEGLLARARGVPTLWHVHEMLPDTTKGRRAAHIGARAGMAVVAVSQASAAALGRAGIDAGIVYECAPLPAAAPPRARRPDGRLVVGTVGVVSKRKGSDIFVDAADRVLSARDDIEIRLVGSPTDLLEERWGDEVLRRARALGVTCLPSADVMAQLREWDLFVLPSRRDPFPISLLEAMGSGLPVVGTRVDGIAEQVTSETGVLVADEDAAGLASAILDLADQPDVRATMGAAGRARVAEHFTLERQADALDAAYEAVLRR